MKLGFFWFLLFSLFFFTSPTGQTSPLVSKPEGLPYTPQELKPFLTYELLSGWTGYREYLKIYPEGRAILLINNPLLSIKEIKIEEVPLDTLKPLLIYTDGVKSESLKLEYKGPDVFDAPVERITLKGKSVILSPTAPLPAYLSDIKREIFRLKGFLKPLPSFPILSVDSVMKVKDSLREEEICIEGVFLRDKEAIKIIKELSSPEIGIELEYEPPPDFLNMLKEKRYGKVILIGRLNDEGILRVSWIELIENE